MPLPKGDNRNRPLPGSILNTEPIRDHWAIDQIKQRLLTLPTQREYLLFVLGINSGWRVTDLLNTHWTDLLALNQTSRVWTKRESKTGKIRRVIANDAIFEAIAKWQISYPLEPPEPSEFIFVGQRGRICPATVTMWVKDWTKQISLPGRFGGRSLRQTWAYQQIQAGQSLPLIMKRKRMKFLFLDVDGTIVNDYKSTKLLMQVPITIARFTDIEEIILVSNQGGVGLRLYLEQEDCSKKYYKKLPQEHDVRFRIGKIQESLQERTGIHVSSLVSFQFKLDNGQFTQPDGKHEWAWSWRKPEPGMIIHGLEWLGKLYKDRGFTYQECLMVGDREEDKFAAEHTGIPFIFNTEFFTDL